jgi:hypothetical protein
MGRTQQTNCCLCGEPAGLTAGSYYFRSEAYRFEGRQVMASKICERHFDDFMHWRKRCKSLPDVYDENCVISLDDFNRWLASVLRKAAEIKNYRGSVVRCEAVSQSTGERCIRFALAKAKGHQVCGIHDGMLRQKRHLNLSFDARNVTVLRINEALEVLLGQNIS